MISELLSMLKSGMPMTLKQMADKLNTTCDVVESMLEMLVKKGVVEKNETCTTSSACEKCKMKCGCGQQASQATKSVSYKLTIQSK